MNTIIGIYKRTVSILCIILLCANCVSASPVYSYTLSPASTFTDPGFSELSGLIKELFDWARGWRSRAPIRALNLRKWLTSSPRRLSPTQVQKTETLIINTSNSTLIFYPKETNELGIELPNSIYRVYRIPRCIDIDRQNKLDSIFKAAGSIKMAERIAEILLKGEKIPDIAWGELRESADTIILNPGIFLWAQRILKQRLGNAPNRYALERKLILALLLQSFPDLEPGFGEALEEFSQHGDNMGKWIDLEYADSFILSKNIHKKPHLFNLIAQMAKQIEDIHREMGGNEIEMNSCINVCSSLKALARIINESGIGEDFDNPVKIAARLCLYNTEFDKQLNLLTLLGNIKEGLSKYQGTRIKGLDELLKEIDKALEEKGTLEDFRKGILGEVLLNLFSQIPKADIHHHLDGSISPELAFKFLQKYPKLMELYGNPKSPEDLKPYIEFNYRGEGEINWNELWPKFALFTHIVNTSLDEVAFVFRESSLEDFYNDGVTLIEHKVSIITPGQDPGIDPARVLEAAIRGLIEAEEKTKGRLQTGLIPCIWKTPQHILGSRYAEVAEKAKSDPEIIIREAREEALRQVKIVVDLKKRWEREHPEYVPYLIGIDTVGDEKDYIREVTAPALQYAAENGLKITEHLGENWNPGELKQALLRIKEGIESGITKRIGHATALGIETKDEELRGLQEEIKELIRRNNIHIETCPSSNKLLAPERSIPRYQDHPVVRFYRELGNVSINTDDSWILHTRGLSGEFMKVWLSHPEVRWSEIEDIIGNGFKASFIDIKNKTRITETIMLRPLIHDFLNCLNRIMSILEMQSKRGNIERDEYDEYDRHYKKMDKIRKGYEEIRNSIGIMAAIDFLRNNINIYRDFADWTLGKVENLRDKMGKEIIEVLETSTRDLLALLKELEGTGSKETGPIDLIKIIRSLTVTTSDVNLELDIPGDLPEVLIPQDELSILRVFWNLMGNSIRAMQDMAKKDTTFIGKIKISARIDKGRLMLSFEDNGSGIKEEYLRIPEGKDRPWIFLSGATTKTDEPGEHGLGLSYVWDTVVNKWGGKIGVESTVGAGTRFTLEIPIEKKATPDDPQELIRKGLDEILQLVPGATHEILAHNIFDLLMHCFVFLKGSPRFEEYLKGTILADITRKFQDTLVKNSAAWLATRGVVKDIVEITEILKVALSEIEKEKLIDKLSEEFKERFYTPIKQYRYGVSYGVKADPNLQSDLRQLGERYLDLKRKVEVLNQWLREQHEILQVRLNLDHQGTYFDVANAVEQRILFGSDPHIMYDLHDDNAGLGIKITEANWVGYARNARLFPWVAHVRPVEPGTTVVRIPEVSGIASVSICFDYFSYYGFAVLEKIIVKDEKPFRPTDVEIENMVNQIIEGLILDNLDVRLFSMAISPAYIWPDQAEVIVDKLLDGIKRYVTQRKESGWYKKRLDELIPSPLLEDNPDVNEFINETLSTNGPEEIEQLDDNELSHRLYYALEYPGIGIVGRPCPSKNWWRHVVIHLKGTVIGGERYIEEHEKVREAIAKHQSISNLLKEWLRRKWNIVRVVNAIEILLTRYSNVHRGMGQHSQISTHLYERAREIVAEHLGVDLNRYTIIFGSDLERIKKNLIHATDYKIVDPDISSLFGITAVAVRKENLRKGAPYEPGGGTVALVLENDVVWADSPDRFEPGTPNIAGAIALAKALQIGLKPQQETATIDPDGLIRELFYQEDPGEKLLSSLNRSLIGWQAGVPTRNGYLPYVNFDNGASTPTFRVIFDAYKKALRLPESVRGRLIEEVRRICRDFFNAPQGEYDVIFTKNTTEGINIIAHNLELAPDSVVLNSFLEHNSNELPWRYMPGVSQERLSVDENGFFDLNELEDKLRNNPKIKLVAISGASNVLGSVNDIKETARISHKYGALVLVDAAQLIAHRQIDMHEWGIDFIAFSGHKAYAPFGASGIVVKHGKLKEKIKDIDNTAGITALGRALLMLKRIRMEHIVQHERELTEYTLERLKEIDGIVIYGTTDPEDIHRRLGVISFNLKGLAHALVAGVLAEEGGIGVRSGCFCAHLLMQKMLGISEDVVQSTRDELKRGIRPQMPGEVRISLGLYNTKEEIDRLIEILKKIAAGEYDLTRYQYEKETGHYYTRKYRARLDIFIHQIEEKVFGISHYKDAIELSKITDVDRRLLGNKGVKFGVFNKLGMDYPNGFIIDSDTIRNTNDQEFLDNLFFPWIRSQIRALETKTGKTFGNPQNPLLLAVRSSPEFSMPAILSTILNVGINDEIAQNLAQRYGESYAYDTYRRFIEEYGISVLGLDKEDFEMIFQSTKEKGMKAVVDEYKKYIAGMEKEIPQDVWVQLEESMVVVIRSWDIPRAKMFRVAEGISKEAGFSVIVQEMVFGNLNKHSAAGVLFTRNPNTGKDEIFGNYLTTSQGEDIVSGRLRGMPIQDLINEFPDIFKRLIEIGKTLEKAQSWPQEIEFVVEDNKLYIIQARDIEFAAPVRETVLKQLEEEGITNRYQAIDRLEKWQMRQRMRRIFRVKSGITVNPLFNGTSSTPGAVKGRLALNIDKAFEYMEQGDGVILLLTPQSRGVLRNLFVLPDVGLITTFGNESFHEAVLCRLSGVPAIICVDEEELRAKFKEGDLIVLDGDNNRIFVAEEDVLEEVPPITDITYGIDIIEYQRGFNKGKEEFSYEELMELNVLYREKFLALTARLKEDQDNPNLRREAFIANLEKHLVHELLHKAGEALGKTREEVNSQLGEVIRLVDLGKIIHQMGDLILFEQRVISDIQKTEAIAQAEEIVRENPGSEIRVEKLDDRFGAELVKVVKPGEAEILYQDEYLWYPYDNDRDKELEERRAEAKRVLDAFPGARVLERYAMTCIHEGGGTETMYYFIVYRRKENPLNRLHLEEAGPLPPATPRETGGEKTLLTSV